MNEIKDVICLIDDEESVRKSMKRLLVSAGFVVQTFESVDSYLNDQNKECFTCFILDIAMPKINGMQFLEQLNAADSYIPVIFLTAHADVHLGVEAMKKGALDFLIKPIDENKLFSALKKAFTQYRFRYKNKKEFNEIQQQFNDLTGREKEVLKYIIGGAINREIAAYLNISEKTVKIHRGHIMQKMNVSTPVELGHKCAKLDFIPLKNQ